MRMDWTLGMILDPIDNACFDCLIAIGKFLDALIRCIGDRGESLGISRLPGATGADLSRIVSNSSSRALSSPRGRFTIPTLHELTSAILDASIPTNVFRIRLFAESAS